MNALLGSAKTLLIVFVYQWLAGGFLFLGVEVLQCFNISQHFKGVFALFINRLAGGDVDMLQYVNKKQHLTR